MNYQRFKIIKNEDYFETHFEWKEDKFDRILQNYVVKYMESCIECLDKNGDGPSRIGSSTNIQCSKWFCIW